MSFPKSPSSRGSVTCASGSPNRALYSSTLQPPRVRMSPAKMTPRYGVPRRTRARAIGAMSSSARPCASPSGSTPVGENAPMPPVFGPVSPSPTRLWSFAGGSATTVSPSTSAWSETSSPSSTSSSTIAPPPTPGVPTASRASLRSRATTTPLPAASPSAFTTTGPSRSASAVRAVSAFGYDCHAAVGMPASAMSSFAYDLLHSIRAASREGATTAMPHRRRTSPSPCATSSSGPTIARSICDAAT